MNLSDWLITAWPALGGFFAAFLFSFWLSLKSEAWFYRHTGRPVSAVVWGISLFLILFFASSQFIFTIVRQILEAGGDEYATLPMVYSIVGIVLYILGFFFFSEVMAVFWEIHILKRRPVDKNHGLSRFAFILLFLIVVFFAVSMWGPLLIPFLL